jgi:hypothetical protein
MAGAGGCSGGSSSSSYATTYTYAQPAPAAAWGGQSFTATSTIGAELTRAEPKQRPPQLATQADIKALRDDLAAMMTEVRDLGQRITALEKR